MTLINHRSNGRHAADIPIPHHLANVAPNTTPLRALLVDDNDHFIQTARDHLERDGINVIGLATTSAEALRKTRTFLPNVVLIDIMLGTEFGFDLAHTLTQAVQKSPRMIMMSTYAATDFAEMLDASPAIGFLPKTRLSGSAIQALVTQSPQADRPRADGDAF
jgi:ActR/RegA family two-component response regulator